MAPDAGVALEIRGAITRAVGVAPEAQRHRGQRLPADQLAGAAGDRPALLVERREIDPQARRLDLAGVDRLRRHAEHEAADDVGAAGDAGEMDVRLDLAVDPLEAGPRERRSGREDGAQRREAVAPRRHQAGGAAAVDEARAGPEVCHLQAVDRVPQHVEGRMRGRPVVEHDGRAFRQRGDQPVPHHPAAGGEVEQAIAGPDVAVQMQFRVVLQQHAAGPVHQRLGQAGRAGGVEHREGVIEGQRRRGERRRRAGQPVGPGHGVEARDGLAQDDDARRSGQARRQIGDDRAGLEAPAVIRIRGRGEQQLRRDLVEAGVGGVGAEVGRAGREDRPARGAGEVQDHRLRHVGDEGGDGVADADAVAGQRRRGAADPEAQAGAGDHAILGRFVGGDDRGGVLGRASPGEQGLGVVHGHAGEPARVWHRRVIVRPVVCGVGCAAVGQAALAQAGPPERVGLRDRPGVQRPVVVERTPGRHGGGAGKGGQVRAGRPRRGRRPQRRHGSRCPRPAPAWITAAARRLARRARRDGRSRWCSCWPESCGRGAGAAGRGSGRRSGTCAPP